MPAFSRYVDLNVEDPTSGTITVVETVTSIPTSTIDLADLLTGIPIHSSSAELQLQNAYIAIGILSGLVLLFSILGSIYLVARYKHGWISDKFRQWMRIKEPTVRTKAVDSEVKVGPVFKRRAHSNALSNSGLTAPNNDSEKTSICHKEVSTDSTDSQTDLPDLSLPPPGYSYLYK